jgi:hypothetical protein
MSIDFEVEPSEFGHLDQGVRLSVRDALMRVAIESDELGAYMIININMHVRICIYICTFDRH